MWDVFISHAAEDKEDIARRLAEALTDAGLRVWYDDFTLRLGDSLSRSIDRGLAESRYGIVILSPYFFAKEWPQKELNGLTVREVSSGKIILPIWHKVSRAEVERFSPTLADKLSVSTDKGFDVVVREIISVLQEEPRGRKPQPRQRRTPWWPFAAVGGLIVLGLVWIWVPPPPPPPQPPPPQEIFLSDLTPTVRRASYRRLGIDRTDWLPHKIVINGKGYDKGLVMHPDVGSDMIVEYVVPKGAKSFHALIGLADPLQCGGNGSARFLVSINKAPPNDLGIVRVGEQLNISPIPVHEGDTITLITNDAGDGNQCDHATWANARFVP
jgi:hypothetical protein